MTLREQLSADVAGVFLCEDDFAEWHALNDTPCKMVVDSDRLERWKTANLQGGIGLPENALADAQIFLFVAVSDFPEPRIGQVVRFDGRPLRAISSELVGGMLELVLGGATEYGY